jgi:hypothetical protein
MSAEEKKLTTWPIQNENFLEEVQGIHKRRDLLILEKLAEGTIQVEVAKDFNLRQARVSCIAINNRALLDKLTFSTKFATKAGRLRLAFRCLQGRTSSKKDTIEILEYLRKELEGDVQFKQQINQFINLSDEDLDSIIKKGLQEVKDVKGKVVK